MVTDTRARKNGAGPIEKTARRGRPPKDVSEAKKPIRSQQTERGIVRVRTFCVGTSPLLMDPMTQETQDALSFGTHVQIKKDTPHEQVAAAKVIKNAQEQIILPGDYARACLVEAGTNVKFDAKSKISTLQSTKLFGFFWIQSEELVLTTKEGRELTDEDWEVDIRPGRLDNGTAIIIRRPKFRDWAFELVFEYDENRIDENKLFELFRAAGVTQGLGSFRPNCKGGFGMFELSRWMREARRPAINNLEIIDLTASA